jgi:hypothetical protein
MIRKKKNNTMIKKNIKTMATKKNTRPKQPRGTLKPQ